MLVFARIFGEIADPRARNRQFDLVSILFIAFLAMLCGAKNCYEMEVFANSKRKLLIELLGFPNCSPSHDTFCRVFRFLDPVKFEAAFSLFSAAFATGLKGVVAIDGKAVRGAFEKGKKTAPLHLVNVWAVEARLAIAQRIASNRNEIRGALEALSLLSLDGCIVTADALYCRHDIAKAIIDTGADYALVVKRNHPGLLAQLIDTIDNSKKQDCFVTTSEKSHGRDETRKCTVVSTKNIAFPNTVAIAKVEAVRLGNDGKMKTLVRHYLLSKKIKAERMIEVSRSHWTIENQLHWVLDVTLNEDAARNRKDHCAQNLATLRKIVLNTLRASNDKASLTGKMKKAGWNDDFLKTLISHMR